MNIVTREARLLAVKVLLQKGYEWLACDADGTIVAYEVKPFKMTEDEWWNYDSEEPKFLTLDNAHDINFVKWEDEEPTNIAEWIKKEEEEMKLYYVRNGQLESKDVDATNGIVALGVNDVVELDRDNKIVTDSATIKVGELFREGFEAGIDYGYEPSVQIVADNFEYTNKMPRQLSLADLDNVKVHDRICLELNNIYEKKNADYGNSFENSLDKHGLIAGIVRMDDKMSRLISLNSKNEQQVIDESLRDTLMDLANYAIMSVMWLDEQ